MRDVRAFWHALERRLPEVDRDREREIASSVLLVLRSRIRPAEAHDLERALPSDLGYIRSLPGAEPGTHVSGGEDKVEYEDFVRRVRALARLSGIAEAERATCAVLGALCEVIPEEQARRLEDRLSPGLRALWRGEEWPGRRAGGAVGGSAGAREEAPSETTRPSGSVADGTAGPRDAAAGGPAGPRNGAAGGVTGSSEGAAGGAPGPADGAADGPNGPGAVAAR